MSFFKRMLSSVGIGSAKVDTVLEGEEYAPGDEIRGVVNIKGGKTEQQIQGLKFCVQCTYEATVLVHEEMDNGRTETSEEDVTRTALLAEFELADDFVIGPGEEEEIAVSIDLPFYAPLTYGKTKVWIYTGLDIKKAIDAGDKDYIEVVPDDLTGALFDALEDLGFKLVNAECEEAPDSFRRHLPFVQEFEFKPVGGPFHTKLDELEIICFREEDHAEVYVEVDRKAKGLSGFIAEIIGADESGVRFDFGHDDIPDLADKLHEMIGNLS